MDKHHNDPTYNPMEDIHYMEEFLEYVVESLIEEEYCNDEEESLKMIKDSILIKMFKKDPQFVFHYNPEYWAEKIFNQQILMVTT